MKAKIYIILSNDDLRQVVPVIVEMWDHKKDGRGKRRWLAEFSEKERRKLTAKYSTLYAWYLRRGFPAKTRLRPKTWALLVKAAQFFASL